MRLVKIQTKKKKRIKKLNFVKLQKKKLKKKSEDQKIKKITLQNKVIFKITMIENENHVLINVDCTDFLKS